MIATIPGRRPDRLVLASHFDTKLYREFRFVGANDGASSTAALLELGRVPKSRQNELTIELCSSTVKRRGARSGKAPITRMAAATTSRRLRRAGSLKTLKALVLLDMIGDQDLVIKRDANSTPWLVDVIWSAAAPRAWLHVFQPVDDRGRPHPVPSRRRCRGRHHRPREPDVAHGSGRPRPRQCQEPAGRRRCGGRVHPRDRKADSQRTLTVGRVLFLRPGGSIKQDSPYEPRPSPGSRVPGVSFTP